MAHSLSAKKRNRQNIKRRAQNRVRKSMIKTQTKHFLDAVGEGNVQQAQAEYKTLSRKLDKVASTSAMHKNTAARIKSRMARRLNRMQAKAG